jgi:hypothetical protein
VRITLEIEDDELRRVLASLLQQLEDLGREAMRTCEVPSNSSANRATSTGSVTTLPDSICSMKPRPVVSAEVMIATA